MKTTKTTITLATGAVEVRKHGGIAMIHGVVKTHEDAQQAHRELSLRGIRFCHTEALKDGRFLITGKVWWKNCC